VLARSPTIDQRTIGMQPRAAAAFPLTRQNMHAVHMDNAQ
jgi:hypothetical protein